MSIEKRALHLDEWCFAHGVGKSKMYEEIKAGRLKVRKVGKRSIITNEDSDAWLAALPLQNDVPTAA